MKRIYLDGIQGATGTFWMELDTPDFLSRVSCGLDTLNGGIIAINEEGLPSFREWVLKLQSVLMILTGNKMLSSEELLNIYKRHT